MTLGEFKDYIENFDEGFVFYYGISEPFSWRGSYNEVAFKFLEGVYMKREKILEHIDIALTGEFYGYKGGLYNYTYHTFIHFEEDTGSYTDGGYCARKIANIELEEPYMSEEERLVKKAFKG